MVGQKNTIMPERPRFACLGLAEPRRAGTQRKGFTPLEITIPDRKSGRFLRKESLGLSNRSGLLAGLR